MIKVIDIKEDIMKEDRHLAAGTRLRLRAAGTFMINVMGSPGSGKTSLLIRLISGAKATRRIAVIEGDVDSTIDAEAVFQAGAEAVQIRTGGFCHLDSAMVSWALDKLGPEKFDFIFVENIGNLICPAEHDVGAFVNIVLLSVPEGQDKPWKYPGVFRKADAVVINKIDNPDFGDFDMPALRGRLELLHPGVRVFPLSARTGTGVSALGSWLDEGRTETFSLSGREEAEKRP